MSYVNGTTHYNLPQTVGTDKRDWADTNQAFADVDAALYTASETASTAASNISTLDNQINGEGGIDARLTTAENDIDNVEGSVSTLQNTVSGHTTAIAAVRTDCEDMIVAVEITAAQMEDSPVAIPTGSYFRYNDVLYVATSDIAIHDVIVPNTNCEATNVATELGEIKSALSNVETDLTPLTYSDIGAEVTIESGYTATADGYFTIANAGATGDFTLTLDSTDIFKYYFDATKPYEKFAFFVKKGMTITWTSGMAGGAYYIRYNPFVAS